MRSKRGPGWGQRERVSTEEGTSECVCAFVAVSVCVKKEALLQPANDSSQVKGTSFLATSNYKYFVQVF